MDVAEDFEKQHIIEDVALKDISHKDQQCQKESEGKCTKLLVIQETKCIVQISLGN